MVDIPSNFQSVIADFTSDLTITFPEYAHLWTKWNKNTMTDDELRTLFDYCIKVLPERFFDILYQNDDLFSPESTKNTCFLPDVDFKLLFGCEGIS